MNDRASILIALKIDTAFDRRAFSGIASAAHAAGDTLLHMKGPNQPFAAAVATHLVDGIVLSSDDPQVVAEAVAAGKPCVNISNYPAGQAQAPMVGNDDVAIGRLVAEHFLERGFRNFAHFSDDSIAYFHPRRDAFVTTLREAGFACAVGPPPMDGDHLPTWEEHAGRWLASLPRPLAVMTPYDTYGREAIVACRVAGLRVPTDVSIVSVDNDDMLCMTVWPQLSSVATAASQIGYEAFRILRSMLLDGQPPPSSPIVYPPHEIVLRGSSSEVAVDDAEVASAVQFIHSRVAQRVTVQDLVQHTAISRRALERRFVSAFARTPMDEIRRARLERAKRLLIETDLSLDEVARLSGLIRQQRLCSVLKQATGHSPNRFRAASRRGWTHPRS